MSAEEARNQLLEACDEVCTHVVLRETDDGATIEGEPWHILVICLALPLFDVSEVR